MLDAPPIPSETYKKYVTYLELFQKSGWVTPTHKQFIFAKTYLETLDSGLAWRTAGYMSLKRYAPCYRKYKIRAVMNSPVVKLLFNISMVEFAQEMNITGRTMGLHLIEILHNADNVKDQIDAIRELAKVCRVEDIPDYKPHGELLKKTV